METFDDYAIVHPLKPIHPYDYDIYFSHEFLLKEIYPHTKSCTGTAWATQGFTRVCGKCFWCHERRWAFGEKLYPLNHLTDVGKPPPGYNGTLKSYNDYEEKINS